MIALALMLAGAAPVTSRPPDDICRAMVVAIDRGADPEKIAAVIDRIEGYGSDSIRLYCAGYLSAVQDERDRRKKR